MVTVVTRAGKGSALTHGEMDANINNLNIGKFASVPATTSGTNTVTVSDDPTEGAYETGRVYEYQIGGTNTGAVTLAIDGLAATAVQTVAGNALIGGELLDGQVVRFLYNGTNFRVLNPSPIFQGCRVFLDADQSIADDTAVAVAFDQESFDTNSIHDNATNNTRLTVPTGVTHVQIVGQVWFAANATGYRQISIRKDGGTTWDGYAVVTTDSATVGVQWSMVVSTTPILVAAAEYFELYVHQNSTGALNCNGNAAGNLTSFSMHILDPFI